MKKTQLLFAILLAGVCVASRSAPPAPLATPKPDVVNGAVAPANTAAWQVALFRTGHAPVDGLFCGGVQLNDTWILTAAHCFYSTDCKPMGFGSVWVGHGQQTLRNDIARKEIAEVLEPGPGFDCASKSNDIALVRLKKPISNSVTIRLPTGSQVEHELQPGKIVQIVGWGKTFETGQLQQHLMEAALPVQDRSACVAKHGSNLPQGVICAGGRSQDACTGDSGGPLFVRQGGQNATVFGIVSYSRGCGQQGVPGVYTAVGPHLNWINSVVKPQGAVLKISP